MSKELKLFAIMHVVRNITQYAPTAFHVGSRKPQKRRKISAGKRNGDSNPGTELCAIK